MLRTTLSVRTLLTVAAITLLMISRIDAANRIWDGGGVADINGNFLWSDALNWDGNLTSPVGGDTLTFGGTIGTPQFNDLVADTIFNGITFNAGTGAFTIVPSNRISLGGNITDNASNAETINTDLLLSGDRTISVRSGGATLGGGTLNLGGIVSDGGSAKGITLVNNTARLQVGSAGVFTFGGLTLRNGNTYTGGTTIQTGSLTLDFSAATAPTNNIISSSSALTLGSLSQTTTPGASALTVTGKSATANTQTFNGTTVGIGNHTISVANGTSGGSTVLNLGAITRPQAGGVVNFTLPTTGSIQASAGLSNGIIGGWATVGPLGAPTDYATISGGNVVALPVGSYAAATGAGNITNPTFPVGSNVRFSGIAAAAAIGAASTTTDINTILFTDNTTSTATITGTLRLGAKGGIFRSSVAGNNVQTIAGGTLTAGGAASTPGEIVFTNNQQTGVDNNNNNLTVSSVIADNGTGFPVSVIKAGRGAMTLSGANTYTGGTYVTDGRLQVSNSAALGTGPVYVQPGGHLFFSNSVSNNLFISGLGSIETAGNFGAIRINTTGALSGTVTLIGDSRISSTNASGNISGKITGNFNLEFGGDIGTARTDTQVVAISNVNNDWNGTTTINRGTLKLGNSNVIPDGAAAGNVVLDSTGTATNAGGAIFDLNGKNETINGLSTSGTNQTNSQIASNVAGTGTLTVGNNNASGSFAGNLLDGNGLGKLAIVKTGTGTQTFSGVNFLSGGMTVNNGTLALAGGQGVTSSSQNGTWANNNTLITGLASTAGLLVGQSVTGTGIPANSYITGINSATSININNNLTPAAGPIALTFGAGGSAFGTGAVNVNSPGILDVTGVTNPTLGTQTLTNNGTVTGAISTGNTGTIKGTGTFANTVTLQGSSATVGGIIAPGNSIGTMNVDSITASGGGVLQIELSGATSDVLHVVNSATLAGSGITVSVLSPLSQPFYDVITAGNLVSAPALNTTDIGRTHFALEPTPPANTVRINVTGGPANVRWTGAAANQRWESTQLDASWTTTDPVADTTHYYDGDFVTFNDNNGGNYTVNIIGTVSPGSTTFDNSNQPYTLGGGALAGSGSLTKNGSSALTISSTANTFSGGTVLNNGTLNLNAAGALGTGSVTLNGGTIDNITAATITLTNSSYVFGGSFTFTGTKDLTLNTGAVTLNAANPTITVGTAASTFTIGGAIGNGTGNSFTKGGPGILTLAAASSFSGGVTIGGGTVRVNNATGAGTGPITVNSSSRLIYGAVATNAVTLNDGSTVGTTLSLNPLAADFTINASAGSPATLRMADPLNLPTTAGTDVSEVNITGTLHGSGTLQVLSNGQDNASPDGGNGFRLRGTNSSDFSGKIIIGNNVKGEIQTSVAGPFSPAGTGTIVLTAGQASLGNTQNTPDGVNGYSEFNLRNLFSGNTVFGNNVEITGTGLAIVNPTGAALTGASITMGNLKIGANQELGVYLASGSNTQVIVFPTVTLTGNATFSPRTPGFGATTAVGSDLSFGVISDGGSGFGITMNGARTLTLTGTSTYTGTTNITNGTLVLANATNTIADTAPVVVNGGTLDYGAVTDTVGAITLTNGTITSTTGLLSASSITLQNGTVSGNLGGAGVAAINKTTAGTVILSGSNTVAGGINILAGTLTSSSAGALSTSGTLTIGDTSGTSPATLNYASTGHTSTNATGIVVAAGSSGIKSITTSSGSSFVNNASITLNDNLTIAGNAASGSLRLAGNMAGTGGLTISGNSVTLGGASGSPTGQLNFNGGITSTATTLTLNNTPSSNNYAGNTVITSGTLKLNAAEQIPDGSGRGDVTIGAAATLDMNGNTESMNGLSGSGIIDGSVAASAASPSLNIGGNDASGNFSGLIKNTGATLSLSKVGGGTQILSGNNTYSGSTLVASGKLLVNGSHIGGGNYTVVVATLGGTGTIGSNVNITSGGTLAPGASIGTLHLGGTTDLSGTLNTELSGNLSDVLDSTGTLNINSGSIANFTLLTPITATHYVFGNYSGALGGAGTFTSVSFTVGASQYAPTGASIDYTGGHLTLNVSPQSLRGNFNLDNVVDSNDIPAMLAALTDLNAYKANHPGITDNDLLALGDFDNSGTLTNSDIQGELNYVVSVTGGGSVSSVPEPATIGLAGIAALALMVARKRFGNRSRRRIDAM